MQLPLSFPLCLLSVVLLATACGTDNKKSGSPETLPEIPISPTCSQSQILDAETKTCRKPTARECLQKNSVLNGSFCDDVNVIALDSKSAIAPRVNLAAFCEKNTAGAFVNCKDGVFSVPVASLPHVDGTPESFKTMAFDQEFRLEHSINLVGEIKINLDSGTETFDLMNPTDITQPSRVRNMKAGDSISLIVSFGADTIIHGSSEIRIMDQLVTYHDNAQILKAIAAKMVSSKWLSDETTRQAQFRGSKSLLNSEWLKFLKDDVKGDVVWSLQGICPADKQLNFINISSCSVDQRVESKPAWKNQEFINTCRYFENSITVEYGSPLDRHGLLSYGKFLADDFSIFIPKGTRFIGPPCFIKVIE